MGLCSVVKAVFICRCFHFSWTAWSKKLLMYRQTGIEKSQLRLWELWMQTPCQGHLIQRLTTYLLRRRWLTQCNYVRTQRSIILIAFFLLFSAYTVCM